MTTTRVAGALLLLLTVVAAATDCTSYCRHWTADDGSTVQLLFTPCTLSVDLVHIAYAGGATADSYPDLVSTYQCGPSGSGTQLSIAAPVAGGTVQLVWYYANGNSALVCDTTLRGTSIDSSLTLLGFSVAAPDEPLLTWTGAEAAISAAAACPEGGGVSAASETYATLLAQPYCYTNAGSRYTMTGTTDTQVTVRLLWSFQSLLDSTVDTAALRIDTTDIPAASPALQCTFNLGSALLQIYDAALHNWALSWTYRSSYPSCSALLQALSAQTDVAPDVESAVVVVPGDQVYSWELDAAAQQTTTPLSARKIDCPSPSPSQTPSPTRTATRTVSTSVSATRTGSPSPSLSRAASPSTTPSAGSTSSTTPVPTTSPSRTAPATASATPSASAAPQPLPVQPFVNCITVPTGRGLCTARFGYYNPNPWPVALDADTAANQILRATGVQWTALPTLFEPGMHNNTVTVQYSCNQRGLPSVSWKLRTPVPSSVADQLEDQACSRGCSTDLIYSIDHCSGLFAPRQPESSGPDVPVMRCARSDPGTAPGCILGR